MAHDEHDSRYLTAELPGTGGLFKETPGDFLVEEIPLYLPCGEGEHTYALIEKQGITTLEALRRLCRATGAPERDTGYAGMKDARGITRQTVSLPRVTPAEVMGLDIPGIRILSAERHRNKLRLGHLAGNRFLIRLRKRSPTRPTGPGPSLTFSPGAGSPTASANSATASRETTTWWAGPCWPATGAEPWSS